MDAPTSPIAEHRSPEAPTSRPRLSCLSCKSRKQKCNRDAPRCGRCTQLGEDCVYPTSRKLNKGKRRQVRDLEAKLLQLEDHVRSLGSGDAVTQPQLRTMSATAATGRGPSSMGLGEFASRPPGLASDPHQLDRAGEPSRQTPLDNSGGLDLSPTPFAVSDLREELTTIYFNKLHHSAPMIHRSRYESSLRLPSDLQPPTCLQHAIMAMGAGADPSHSPFATTLYQQARSLAEADEISGQVGYAATVAHAQCWLLIAYFETQMGMFSRAFVSLGRSIRVAQMLHLHQIDGGERGSFMMPHALPPPRDWIELEERRRTWWVIYVADRLVFATSGLPAAIDDLQVCTLLPASEEAFNSGAEERTSTLQGALRGRSTVHSPLATRVLTAALYYRAVNLESLPSPTKGRSKSEEDEYWSQHQDIADDLASILDRVPQGSGYRHATFIRILIHTATMHLHKTAMARARRSERPDASLIASQSKSGIFAAAAQILSVFRSTRDLTVALKNPIQDYAAYIASLVFLEDFAMTGDPQSRSSVVFFLDMLQTLGQSNAVARMLAAQLSAESGRVGIQATKAGVATSSPDSVVEQATRNAQGLAGRQPSFRSVHLDMDRLGL